MRDWTTFGRALAIALPISAALGVLAACGLAAAPARLVALLRPAVLTLLIPAAALAIWPSLLLVPLPGPWPTRLPGALAVTTRLVAGTLPALLLPILARCARLPAGQARAAAGLGASRLATIRLVWLPQLGPAVALGLLLAALLDLAAMLTRS